MLDLLACRLGLRHPSQHSPNEDAVNIAIKLFQGFDIPNIEFLHKVYIPKYLFRVLTRAWTIIDAWVGTSANENAIESPS